GNDTEFRVAKQLTAGAGRISDILKEITSLKPAGFAQDAVTRAHMDLLKAELQHVTAQGQIQARRAAALEDVRKLFQAVDEGVEDLGLKPATRVPSVQLR